MVAKTKTGNKDRSRGDIQQSVLNALYLDEESPYFLAGNKKRLIDAAIQELGVGAKDVEAYLRGEPSYTLHRPCPVRFPRSKSVVAPRVDDTWQADLVEMQNAKLIKANCRTRYLLTVLSKYAWVVTLRSKRAGAVRDTLCSILGSRDLESRVRLPSNLQIDEGKEFYNQYVRELLEEYGINHYSTRGEPKAAVVERFNRTLKELTYKYMTALNTLRYSPALPGIVNNYNRMVHSSMGLAPVDVDDSNASVVWKRLYGRHSGRMWKPFKFREGDFVRTTKLMGKDKKAAGGFGVRASKGAWS